MKLDKAIVQRRLDLMAAEGVVCISDPNHVRPQPQTISLDVRSQHTRW